MEFQVDISGRAANVEAIREALCSIDPAALADRDPLNPVLRISANLPARELLGVLHQSGCAVDAGAIRALASNCCGGCGG